MNASKDILLPNSSFQLLTLDLPWNRLACACSKCAMGRTDTYIK